MTIDKNKLLSTDNAKAEKAEEYGYINCIHYMAPFTSGGVGDLCGNASPQCVELCLGWYSGQAAMVSNLETDVSGVRASRIAKARMFMEDRHSYMNALVRCVYSAKVKATRHNKALCTRLNGSTDLNWSRIKFRVDLPTSVKCGVPVGIMATIPELFSLDQFAEYTKDFERLGKVQSNIHQTFSFSGENHDECKAALAGGHSIAVVFGHGLPDTWWGHPVINGDLHDLRHLDPANVVVGLSPKGRKAKASTNGFIIRDY
jgi:hypothetical protein